MWKKYFKLKTEPREIINPRFGSIDFRRDDLDPEFLRRLYEEEDFPYLELTREGEKHFYGLHQEDDDHSVETGPGVSYSQQEYQEEIINSPSPYPSNARELCQAIEQAETVEEAEKYYRQGSNYKTVQEAFQKKLDNDLGE